MWLKILDLLVIVLNAFVLGMLFSRYSRGEWRGKGDSVSAVGQLFSLAAFTFVMIYQFF